MKKVITSFVLLVLTCSMCFSADKCSKEYLQNNKHIALMNPVAESFAERIIKSTLQKETGGKYKVKFDGYTVSSMKKGVFKNLEITGENVKAEDITIPYVHLKTLTDYNYVDYTKNPVEFKSDMQFVYDMLLSQDSLNAALKNANYRNVISNINKVAYPMFEVKGVSTKILNNKLYILTEYNFPIAPSPKNKIFIASSDFEVKNGKIRAVNVNLDSAYGKISLNKVANMLNLLNPLEFTMQLLENKECRTNVENVNIVDNKVKIDGKISIKGD